MTVGGSARAWRRRRGGVRATRPPASADADDHAATATRRTACAERYPRDREQRRRVERCLSLSDGSDLSGGRSVRHVSRTFGRRRAVDGVDLTLDAGDCLALFGPNGAGKTTLLRVIAGLLKPTSGSVRVGGRELRERRVGARGRSGSSRIRACSIGALTARENVEFAARLYGVPDPRAAAMRALERMRVADRADTPRALAEPRAAAARVDRARDRARAERRAARRAVHGARRRRRRGAHRHAAAAARRRARRSCS